MSFTSFYTEDERKFGSSCNRRVTQSGDVDREKVFPHYEVQFRWSLADLWLKLIIFVQTCIIHYFIPTPRSGNKTSTSAFWRRLADCQIYGHSVNKVRRENSLPDVTSVPCDFCLVPKWSPWLKVCGVVMVLSVAKSKSYC